MWKKNLGVLPSHAIFSLTSLHNKTPHIIGEKPGCLFSMTDLHAALGYVSLDDNTNGRKWQWISLTFLWQKIIEQSWFLSLFKKYTQNLMWWLILCVNSSEPPKVQITSCFQVCPGVSLISIGPEDSVKFIPMQMASATVPKAWIIYLLPVYLY